MVLIVLLLSGTLPVSGFESENYFQEFNDHSDITATSSSPKKEYISESWTIHDGLPVNYISQVYQTPDGYLWLATFSGLVRFDGMNFVEYNSGNTENLLSNRIVLIQKGLKNAFWLTTELGDLIHVLDGQFTWFEELRNWRGHNVLPEAATGKTWIGTHNGLYKHQAGNLTPARHELFEGRAITKIYRSINADFWVFTGNEKAFRFAGGDINSEPSIIDISNSLLNSDEDEIGNTFLAVKEDDKGRIWIGGNSLGYIENGRYYKVDIDQKYLDMWDKKQSLIFDFKQDRENNLLVSTHLGLMKIEDGRLTEIDITKPDQYDYATVAVLAGNAITECPDGSTWSFAGNRVYRNSSFEFEARFPLETVNCDLEQNLWFSSFRNGLLRYRLSLFENITFSYSDNNFYGVFADSYDGLWIGKMFGEISHIDKSGRIERYSTPPGWSSTAPIAELSDGSMLVGNQRCLPDNRLKNGGCKVFTYIEPLRDESVHALFEDSNNLLWAGTMQGLIRMEKNNSGELILRDVIKKRPVRYFIETSSGEIWLATNGAGVVVYRNQEIKRFHTGNGLSSDNIRALYEDELGFVWVATEDRGLNRIDPGSGEITVVRKRDGLYDDGLHKILEDNSGRFWFSTNRGVFWVEKEHLNEFASGARNRIFSTAYTERDGMLNREANGGFQNSGLRTKDGRLWFTTQSGVLIIKPDDIDINQALPNVLIEDVLSSGTSLIDESGAVTINPGERSFSVRYNSPAFFAPERIRFRYMLEGLDTDWVDAGNRREAIYTNVPAGEYLFKVAAYYDSDNIEVLESSLPLKVVPLFYEKAWFSLSVVFFIVLLIGGGYRIRLNQMLKREQELESIVKERTEALRTEKKVTEAQAEKLKMLDQEKNRLFANISHEFRTPLTLTIGPLEDLRNEIYGPLNPEAKEQVELGIRNARRLLRLVGQLLDLTRLESKKFELNLKTGNLSKYLHTLSNPFKQAAKRRKIHFKVEIPKNPVFANFDPHHFDKIIANLLSNALKFTPEYGTVSMKLVKNNGDIVIHIKDTGSGISEDHLPRLFERFYQVEKSEMQPGTGIGLSIANELTQLHGGEIHVESKPGVGSVFTVRIPEIITSEKVQTVNPEPRIKPVGHALVSDETILKAEKQNGSSKSDAEIRKIILIVDDHADIRAYLRSHLEDEYSILEAASGNEAMELIEEELPDLIISDVMMPDGDGFDLLKRIRSNPETDFLPVILLTARAEVEDKLSGLNIGANDYITKPFQILELQARIENLFKQQKRFKQRVKSEQAIISKENIHHDHVEAKSAGQEFLETVKQEIQKNLSNEDFTVKELAVNMKQSRSNLHRRLNKLTEESPSVMIRRMRLELGAQLLKQKTGTVSEIAYSTGFKSVAHFSRAFRDQYKQTPTEYAKSMTSETQTQA